MPGSDPREILPLTGLRALAAWWVVAFHFARALVAPGLVARGLAAGHLAVDVFFVLSVFVLAERYRDFDVASGPGLCAARSNRDRLRAARTGHTQAWRYPSRSWTTATSCDIFAAGTPRSTASAAAVRACTALPAQARTKISSSSSPTGAQAKTYSSAAVRTSSCTGSRASRTRSPSRACSRSSACSHRPSTASRTADRCPRSSSIVVGWRPRPAPALWPTSPRPRERSPRSPMPRRRSSSTRSACRCSRTRLRRAGASPTSPRRDRCGSRSRPGPIPCGTPTSERTGGSAKSCCAALDVPAKRR